MFEHFLIHLYDEDTSSHYSDGTAITEASLSHYLLRIQILDAIITNELLLNYDTKTNFNI